MQKAIQHIAKTLNEIYPASEIEAFTRIIIEYVSKKDFRLSVLDKKELNEKERLQMNSILNRLVENEPIQYILGETEFYGLLFRVDQHVLIPRPETEELVELMVNENKGKTFRILDIGTGSGCIAIALKKNMKNAFVEAWDFSQSALNIAKENTKLNNTTIDFEKVDILSLYPKDKNFDIIVSNPPYIEEREKKQMEANVLNFEPHSALFVPNGQALLFYTRIAEIAIELLESKGKLYFEVNREQGLQVVRMLYSKGFAKVSLIKDMSNNDRIVKAELA